MRGKGAEPGASGPLSLICKLRDREVRRKTAGSPLTASDSPIKVVSSDYDFHSVSNYFFVSANFVKAGKHSRSRQTGDCLWFGQRPCIRMPAPTCNHLGTIHIWHHGPWDGIRPGKLEEEGHMPVCLDTAYISLAGFRTFKPLILSLPSILPSASHLVFSKN